MDGEMTTESQSTTPEGEVREAPAGFERQRNPEAEKNKRIIKEALAFWQALAETIRTIIPAQQTTADGQVAGHPSPEQKEVAEYYASLPARELMKILGDIDAELKKLLKDPVSVTMQAQTGEDVPEYIRRSKGYREHQRRATSQAAEEKTAQLAAVREEIVMSVQGRINQALRQVDSLIQYSTPLSHPNHNLLWKEIINRDNLPEELCPVQSITSLREMDAETVNKIIEQWSHYLLDYPDHPNKRQFFERYIDELNLPVFKHLRVYVMHLQYVLDQIKEFTSPVSPFKIELGLYPLNISILKNPPSFPSEILSIGTIVLSKLKLENDNHHSQVDIKRSDLDDFFTRLRTELSKWLDMNYQGLFQLFSTEIESILQIVTPLVEELELAKVVAKDEAERTKIENIRKKLVDFEQNVILIKIALMRAKKGISS